MAAKWCFQSLVQAPCFWKAVKYGKKKEIHLNAKNVACTNCNNMKKKMVEEQMGKQEGENLYICKSVL